MALPLVVMPGPVPGIHVLRPQYACAPPRRLWIGRSRKEGPHSSFPRRRESSNRRRFAITTITLYWIPACAGDDPVGMVSRTSPSARGHDDRVRLSAPDP
jgi:hypothetical protein